MNYKNILISSYSKGIRSKDLRSFKSVTILGLPFGVCATFLLFFSWSKCFCIPKHCLLTNVPNEKEEKREQKEFLIIKKKKNHSQKYPSPPSTPILICLLVLLPTKTDFVRNWKESALGISYSNCYSSAPHSTLVAVFNFLVLLSRFRIHT